MGDINEKVVKSAFLLSLDTLEEFYTRCLAAKAVTEAQKTDILVQLMKEKKAEYIGDTDKTGPELAIELIKKGVKAKSIGFKAKKKTKSGLDKRYKV